MRHRIPRKTLGGPNVRVDVRMSPELRALLDESARRGGLSRSAEINRLLRIGLERSPVERPQDRPIRAHIL